MDKPLPSLNALRAFEAVARHLSFSKAAAELHVTAGALSHLLRGLEEALGVSLFERKVRSIALTAAGKLLYPGLQTGFAQIEDAVAGVRAPGNARFLVVSTPPGLTSKWLAPRLYRFSNEFPDIEIRISSSKTFANFTTDGVDVAIRNLPPHPSPDPALTIEFLIELHQIAVASPRLVKTHGPLKRPEHLSKVPLIHDDTLMNYPEVPTWTDWFKAAGVKNADVNRGFRFNSSDHALDAASEGAGVLLAHDLLASDDLRSGRLVKLFDVVLPSRRGYYFVAPKRRTPSPHVEAFRGWLRREFDAVDRKVLR
jgi:LysR family transcriptional regulator, glycine cleavage system transcriptional activator